MVLPDDARAARAAPALPAACYVSRVSEDAAGSGIEGARAGEGGGPYGILIVDDEPAILESLALTLGADYRVFTAGRLRGGPR